MSRLARLPWFVLLALGCSGPDNPSGLEEVSAGPALAAGTVKLTGSGHHSRTVAGVTALTTFTFNAKDRGDGSATGNVHYNFRASGFTVDGTVTCITASGNQAWVGGVVDRVTSDDPSFQDLVGLDLWWRSIDNGEGSNALPDSTTGLGFKFAGVVITKESWCADQPASLILREVEQGNVQLH
jgi:hypothetical protein